MWKYVCVSVCVCQPGDRCMVVPSLSLDDAKKEFINVEVVSVPSGKEYLRFAPDYWHSTLAQWSAHQSA